MMSIVSLLCASRCAVCSVRGQGNLICAGRSDITLGNRTVGVGQG